MFGCSRRIEVAPSIAPNRVSGPVHKRPSRTACVDGLGTRWQATGSVSRRDGLTASPSDHHVRSSVWELRRPVAAAVCRQTITFAVPFGNCGVRSRRRFAVRPSRSQFPLGAAASGRVSSSGSGFAVRRHVRSSLWELRCPPIINRRLVVGLRVGDVGIGKLRQRSRQERRS